MDILNRIIEDKKVRLDLVSAAVPLAEVREEALRIRESSVSHALSNALSVTDRLNVIAEFKRRSPSKGVIRDDLSALDMVRLYEKGGAAALSVLTEEDHFEGSLDDLRSVRRACDLPILRKDFIFSEYQLFETAAAGADALLLIVSALDDDLLRSLRDVTENQLAMDALIEIHDERELERALACGATMIGINNRDLKTFNVSLDVSLSLVQQVPDEVSLVSESGLHSKTELRQLRDLGFDGFLIGEYLMRKQQPDIALRELIESDSR